MLDTRIARTGDKVVFEFFDRRWRAFSQRLDTAVLKIADVAKHLVPCRRSQGKISIPDALHFAADDELACYDHGK